METYPLLIDGEDVDTGRYEYFPFADKSITELHRTLQVLRELRAGKFPPDWEKYVYARCCVATEQTNQQAIAAAYKASQIYQHFPLSRRKKIMDTIHQLLMEHQKRLIQLMVIEGHPRKLAEWEFLGMEQGSKRETNDFYRSQLVSNVAHAEGEDAYLARKPDGVVCVSPPRNAPCSNSLLAMFALLGGNTIIIKPPLRTPLSTMFLWRNVVWEAARRNQAPPGTVNIIIGNSKVFMEEWLSSPQVSDLLFFGDSTEGLEIGTEAFRRGKKPILELSGNDMMIVWKDAELDGAVESLLDGFLGSMQICMVPKKALIHEGIFERFEERFVEEAKRLRVGLPSDPETCLTPVVKIDDCFAVLEDARSHGADVLCGGERVNHEGKPDPKGIFVTPAVLRIADVEQASRMRCVVEENFFPVMPLVRVSGPTDEAVFKKMVDLANSNAYGLRTSVWVRSEPYLYRFVKYLQKSGLLRVNTRHAGFSPCLSSHGGTGRSGGPYGEMNYVWQKTTHLQGIAVRNIARAALR